MNIDKDFEDVKVEKIIKLSPISKEWRKPDIQGKYKETHIAFELQLSTTFLTEIIGRTLFYREIDTYLIWLFSEFSVDRDIQKFMQKDIFYNNSFNVFVFDTEAMQKSEIKRKLYLKCFYKWYYVVNSQIEGEWKNELISISDLFFEKSTRAVTYFDSDKQKNDLQGELQKSIEEEKRILENEKSEQRIEEALEYVREYIRFNKAHIEETNISPIDYLYSENEINKFNDRLGFSGKNVDFLAKIIFDNSKYAFLNFLIKCSKIKINLSNAVINEIPIFSYILNIDDSYLFSKYIFLLFKLEYQLSEADFKVLQNLYDKNYANYSEYEKEAIKRWAMVSYLIKANNWKEVNAIDLRIIQLNRIMSTKYNLIIDAGFPNMRSLAMNVLNSYQQYSKIFIQALKIYHIYDDLVANDKKGLFKAIIFNLENKKIDQDTYPAYQVHIV